MRTEDEGGFSFATDIGPIRPCLVHNSFGKRGPIGKTVARRTKNNSKARERSRQIPLLGTVTKENMARAKDGLNGKMSGRDFGFPSLLDEKRHLRQRQGSWFISIEWEKEEEEGTRKVLDFLQNNNAPSSLIRFFLSNSLRAALTFTCVSKKVVFANIPRL